MKWPDQLLLIRHMASAYNVLKQQMLQDELYQQFRAAYAHNPRSKASFHLAEQVHHRFPPQYRDQETPLAVGGLIQAKRLGQWLRQSYVLPDVVYVSPYVRTWATLSGIMDGWPELASVRLIEEERIREQEFGARLAYSDWRVYLTLHPDQLELFQQLGPYWYRCAQGENVPDVRSRNRSWMTSLVRDFSRQQVLAVTHHLSILSFRANIERLNAARFMDLDAHHQPFNGSVATYQSRRDPRGERLVLTAYNQQPD
jgi:broad specificity phosphatase PhoE